MNSSQVGADGRPGGAAVLEGAAYLKLTYDEQRLPKTAYPQKLAAYISERIFKRPGRLLDTGCGRGDFLKAFAALGYDVAGVDISPAAPQFAAPLAVAVANLEREAMPYPPASFDFAFSKSVLEHVRQPVAVLTQIYATLKPGGLAVIMVPAWETGYRGSFYIDHTHITPFTLPSLEDAMVLAGFEIERGEYFYQLPFLWRWPVLAPLRWLVAVLPLRYRPMHKVNWPDGFNKLIWFSKEAMLLVVGRRPQAN